MKNILVFNFITSLSLCLLSLPANAALVVQGDDPYAPWDWVVIDTNTNLMWSLTANEPANYGYTDGLMTYQQTNNWVNNYVSAGYNNWRLPSVSEMNNLFSTENISTSNPSPFINLQNWYWTSDSFLDFEGRILYTNVFSFTNGTTSSTDVTFFEEKFNALTVRTIVPVPIPTALILFISGGIFLGSSLLSKRKKA